MNATNELLTKLPVTNPLYRKLIDALLLQKYKVFHMARDHRLTKYLLLRNIVGTASISEALHCTYIGLTKSDKFNVKKLVYKIMEPFFHNTVLPNRMGGIPGGEYCNVCINSHCQDEAVAHVDNSMVHYAIGNLDLNIVNSSNFKEKYARDQQNYKRMRRWQNIEKDKRSSISTTYDTFKLRLLSFNILAQALLEAYPWLYKYHDKEALPWEIRKPLLWEEIMSSEANVICLQEMQEEHLEDFVQPFIEKGYSYLYKKRTNDKPDGLLLLYQKNILDLVEYAKVEYYKPGIALLSRDNVGLIAKFQLKESPETRFIVATTHLLYNPKRNDVRLGQTQLLFAELEKMSFIEYNSSGAKYLPIILSGDFNLEPHTGVYKFITEGSFTYMGKSRQLTKTEQYPLQNTLIPSYLNVTDNCERLDVLMERLHQPQDAKMDKDDSYNSDNSPDTKDYKLLYSGESQTVKITEGHYAQFSTGSLRHPFGLRSVYKHLTESGQLEATTNQDSWITVDYIFYSGVKPVEQYSLPTVYQCHTFPTIPNFAVGSDHLCLGATFEIQKK